MKRFLAGVGLATSLMIVLGLSSVAQSPTVATATEKEELWITNGYIRDGQKCQQGKCDNVADIGTAQVPKYCQLEPISLTPHNFCYVAGQNDGCVLNLNSNSATPGYGVYMIVCTGKVVVYGPNNTVTPTNEACSAFYVTCVGTASPPQVVAP